MIRRPPRSTLFPTRRSSDLKAQERGCERRGPVVAMHDMGPPRERALHAAQHRGHLRQNAEAQRVVDRKSTRLNSSHSQISYAVFCLKKKKEDETFDQICQVN